MRVELPYHPDSRLLFEAVADLPWAAFLDSGVHHPGQSRWDIIAARPAATLVTRGAMTEIRRASAGDGHSESVELSPEDPDALLRRELGAARPRPDDLPFCGGAIGYFGYDLTRRYEHLPRQTRGDDGGEDAALPQMAIALYEHAVLVDHARRKCWCVGWTRPGDAHSQARWKAWCARFAAPVPEKARAPFRALAPAASSFTPDQYAAAFARVQHYIREGDCYQVNLAQRFTAPVAGDPWLAYQALRTLSPAPYSAYLNTPHGQVLSASPERFLRVERGRVETRPIKGTRPRAGHARLDAELARELAASAKDRAENVMIVDLLRNDLSRNCATGSVRVPRLFEVESFPGVHHLVSTVTGSLRPERDALDLLRGCFPGGSITGAPKRRAMQIIDELEPHRRGVYCGAIGYLGYDGDMDLNVAIRTLTLARGQAVFWAGGGIVADSRAESEYQETFDKAAAPLALLRQAAGAGTGAG